MRHWARRLAVWITIVGIGFAIGLVAALVVAGASHHPHLRGHTHHPGRVPVW